MWKLHMQMIHTMAELLSMHTHTSISEVLSLAVDGDVCSYLLCQLQPALKYVSC